MYEKLDLKITLIIFDYFVDPCNRIRNPESSKIWLLECGIHNNGVRKPDVIWNLESKKFRIRNPDGRIRNPDGRNPESRGLESGIQMVGIRNPDDRNPESRWSVFGIQMVEIRNLDGRNPESRTYVDSVTYMGRILYVHDWYGIPKTVIDITSKNIVEILFFKNLIIKNYWQIWRIFFCASLNTTYFVFLIFSDNLVALNQLSIFINFPFESWLCSFCGSQVKKWKLYGNKRRF